MSKLADLVLDLGQVDHGRAGLCGTGSDVLKPLEFVERAAAGFDESKRRFVAPPDYCGQG